MWLGFALAAYAVVGNDSIQTLGTFLASNAKRPWWVLWIFAATILSLVMILGWLQYSGDVSWGRLTGNHDKFPEREIQWFFLLPPLVLLGLTRLGFPVSTSFLVLLTFSPGALWPMVQKSLLGYGVAMAAGLILYCAVLHFLERRFLAKPEDKPKPYWILFQWCSTAWLWGNWLIQDLANIFVYLPRSLAWYELIPALLIMVGMLAYIFSRRGGKIQQVVLQKTNTTDIRSATFVDLIYGTVLFYFKELNDLPMSTTWVFLGLLAGREIAIRTMAHFLSHENADQPHPERSVGTAFKLMGMDAAKAGVGLVASIILAWLISRLDTVGL